MRRERKMTNETQDKLTLEEMIALSENIKRWEIAGLAAIGGSITYHPEIFVKIEAPPSIFRQKYDIAVGKMEDCGIPGRWNSYNILCYLGNERTSDKRVEALYLSMFERILKSHDEALYKLRKDQISLVRENLKDERK